MPFVAGNEIQAFCPTCGRDTDQTVIEVHSGLVLQVRCMTCKEVHPYKRPHGPLRPKKQAKTPRSRPRAAKKKTQKAKAAPAGPPKEWDDLVLGKDPELFTPYSMKQTFELNELLVHPKFGQGVVTELRDGNKIEVAFHEGYKTLIHNR